MFMRTVFLGSGFAPKLLALAAVFLISASHIAHGGEAKSGVLIRKEAGPEGHNTIGLDEKTLTEASDKGIRLTFERLMKWEYELGQDRPAPDQVKKLHNKKVNITGFMYPLQEGKQIQFFCVLRTTQTCCYGPRPQYNQFVFVEAEKPTQFHRLAPVTCSGVFKVEPSPDDGYIYRLEGLDCQKISGQMLK